MQVRNATSAVVEQPALSILQPLWEEHHAHVLRRDREFHTRTLQQLDNTADGRNQAKMALSAVRVSSGRYQQQQGSGSSRAASSAKQGTRTCSPRCRRRWKRRCCRSQLRSSQSPHRQPAGGEAMDTHVHGLAWTWVGWRESTGVQEQTADREQQTAAPPLAHSLPGTGRPPPSQAGSPGRCWGSGQSCPQAQSRSSTGPAQLHSRHGRGTRQMRGAMQACGKAKGEERQLPSAAAAAAAAAAARAA